MRLVFATSNKNKLAEIKAMLPSSVSLLGLMDIGIHEEIPEPGATIKENSLLKAKFVYDFLNSKNEQQMVFADDSGLEVESLNGAPGVFSARFAGIPKSDEKNNLKLIEELKIKTNRRARFVTVITLMLMDKVYTFEGEIPGTIAFEARGTSGFGYDPLFIPQGYRSTFAELGMEIKNTISHRSIAIGKLVDFLENAVSK